MDSFIHILRTRPEAAFPHKATEGSAGFDLHACIDKPVTIAPRALVSVPTGIAIGLPGAQYVALLFARSGLGVKHGITLSNGVGVIDSDYRGEIFVGLCNVSDTAYTIEPDERIAQLVVIPAANLPFVETDSLDETERGSGGFGSTGR